jgi:oxaloacetate decarboxylase alpha subunit
LPGIWLVKRNAKGARRRAAKDRSPAASPRRARSAIKAGGPSADNSPGAKPGGFELSELKQLIRLVQRTGIGELEVTSGGRTVRISAQPGSAVVPHVPAASAGPAPAGAVAPAAPAATEDLVAITSPMVGTFYRAPAPDADPYVEVGSVIEIGQTVCIVEAMKLMNEIESEVRGRIARILIENAQPVEYGQKLFLLEPF